MFNDSSKSGTEHEVNASTQDWGIDKFNIAFVIGVDFMCCGGELATGLWLWFLTLLVACVMFIPVAAIQRYRYGDTWTLALSKAALLSVLVGLPTCIPTILVGAWAAAAGLTHGTKSSPQIIETEAVEYPNDHHPN